MRKILVTEFRPEKTKTTVPKKWKRERRKTDKKLNAQVDNRIRSLLGEFESTYQEIFDTLSTEFSGIDESYVYNRISFLKKSCVTAFKKGKTTYLKRKRDGEESKNSEYSSKKRKKQVSTQDGCESFFKSLGNVEFDLDQPKKVKERVRKIVGTAMVLMGKGVKVPAKDSMINATKVIGRIDKEVDAKISVEKYIEDVKNEIKRDKERIDKSNKILQKVQKHINILQERDEKNQRKIIKLEEFRKKTNEKIQENRKLFNDNFETFRLSNANSCTSCGYGHAPYCCTTICDAWFCERCRNGSLFDDVECPKCGQVVGK